MCVEAVAATADDETPDVQPLVDFCVAARALEIIAEELPLLADAVEADRRDGAGRRSNGEAFVSVNELLLQKLRTGPELGDRVAALGAFDRAGIGREPIEEEIGSDQLIRTAVTAVATTTTLLDSDAVGVGFIKPVTRTLRGAALLPYWVVNGLVRGGTARFLALVGLVAGGVLLGFSLLGALPSGLAGPSALLGLGAMLFGVGYAAMRTGSLVHAAALFAPVSPLVAVALSRLVLGGAEPMAIFGIFTVTTVLAIVAVLIVLASLPNPVHSPPAAMTALWRRLQHAAGTTGVLVLRGVAGLAAFLLVAWATATAVQAREDLVRLASGRWVTVLVVVAVVTAGLGLPIARSAGRWLRRWRQHDGRGAEWILQKVDHTAGVSAGWSWVYGMIYVGVAALCMAFLDRTQTAFDAARSVASAAPSASGTETADRGITMVDWHFALIGLAVGSCLLAVVLLLVLPLVMPARARRSLSRSLAADSVLIREMSAASGGRTPAEAFVDTLVRRGCTYRYLVEPPGTGGTTLVPSAAGRDLIATLLVGSPRVRSSVPASWHLLSAALAGLAALALGLPALAALAGLSVRSATACAVVGVVLVATATVWEARTLGRAELDDLVRPRRSPVPQVTIGLVGVVVGAVGVNALLPAEPVAVRSLLVLAVVLVACVVQFVLVLALRRRVARGSG